MKPGNLHSQGANSDVVSDRKMRGSFGALVFQKRFSFVFKKIYQ